MLQEVARGSLAALDSFIPRHIGPSPDEQRHMLETLGFRTLDELTDAVIPAPIRLKHDLDLPDPRGEHETLAELRTIAAGNQVFRSLIGMGYHDTITPPVILRNILENPGWYTQYTPYQAEISQGRLEALLNFQTMVADLTGLPVANASLLDEATAAAEAMVMCRAAARSRSNRFLVAADCHPQTIAVVQTRAEPLGIEVCVAPADEFAAAGDCFACLVQYPTSDGRIENYDDLIARVQAGGGLAIVATDLLALTLLRPPGEFGADVAIGSAQRFGVPMGAGGPHAAFMSCREALVRKMPGRIIGVSRDSQGEPCYRMAIQTREQHIRREKATSNICTAQALLAIIAGAYAAYHGPDGLRAIARRVHLLTAGLAAGLARLGLNPPSATDLFDTLKVNADGRAQEILAAARARRINLRDFGDGCLGVALDETATPELIGELLTCFAPPGAAPPDVAELLDAADAEYPAPRKRLSAYLSHPVFNTHHSETEMLRYLQKLQSRDLSLTHSMIPLGSCTMKLNATSEMIPVTWPEFGRMHPFAPADQQRGYAEMYRRLEDWLAEITGYAAVSLQPNAGSQGEYAGLLVIRAYHHARGQTQRDVCLIPTSAHGTNPASAVTAGMRVVAVKCDARGNIDVEDLRARCVEHAQRLSALMITYPSTHGVFETTVRDICAIVHEYGGQVYLDGANMNAQVGLTTPGDIGADVCHLNLHKTFCIPHGGGGPGMGPIGVAEHLKPFLPNHPVLRPDSAGDMAIGPVSAAPYGSPSILPISWMYIRMMGGPGLKLASQVAILNANYMARRLADHYPVLYTGPGGRVAHEFILDLRELHERTGVTVDDVAKRLIDFGFHAPTMSWPVAGTLMVEPTESESQPELDRFCDALIAIREEIRAIEEGVADREDNPLRHAPHTIRMLSADEWPHAYPRSRAAYPLPYLREHKFWSSVARVDNVWGDRNLHCTCPPVEAFASHS